VKVVGRGVDGRHEAHGVDAVVHTHAHAVHAHRVLEERGDERQGEVAVGDGAPEGPVLGGLDVGVDPLVVVGGVGEGVDAVLADEQPVADADLLADVLGQLRHVDYGLGHRMSVYGGCRSAPAAARRAAQPSASSCAAMISFWISVVPS
jgi:hypothetical protein